MQAGQTDVAEFLLQQLTHIHTIRRNAVAARTLVGIHPGQLAVHLQVAQCH